MNEKQFENTLKTINEGSHKTLKALYKRYAKSDEKFMDWALNTDAILRSENKAYFYYWQDNLELDEETAREDYRYTDEKEEEIEYLNRRRGEDYYIIIGQMEMDFVVDAFKSEIEDANEAHIFSSDYSTPTDVLEVIQ